MINGIVEFTRPFRYWIDSVQFRRKANTSCLVELRDSLAGETILVVGNGPSLNDTPLDDFAHVPAIGMNKIDLLYPRVKWRPSIVVCVNNIVTQQHGNQFSKSSIPIFVSWKGRKYLGREIRSRLQYFNSLSTPHFSTDIVHGVGFGGTVTYCALQFAYFMGARTVVLFGVDHNFVTDGKAHQIKKREGPDMNHFDPNYFKSGSWWGLPDLESSELAYRAAKDVFESNGRTIYDATINGKLNVFPKISISEAKQICGAK